MVQHNYQRLRGFVAQAVDAELARLRGARSRQRLHRREDYAELPEYKAMRQSGRQNLERFERALRFLFEHGGVKLGAYQKRFLNAVRRVSVTRMFGEQLLANMDFLEREFGITSAERAVCILFPRRSGKTTVQTIDAACTLVSQPDGNVVCFNLNGRQSTAWIKQTMQYLDIFREAGGEFAWTEVDRHMPERLTIRVHALGTDNCVMAFPGAQAGKFENLRGMGIKLFKCYLDEAAFFDEACMPVMAPLLVNGAVLVLTSSIAPGGARAGLMKILDAKYGNGQSVVLEENMIRACAACEQRGQPDQCKHLITLPQHFQRSADIAFVEALLSPWEGAGARELHNQHDKPLSEPAFKVGLDRLHDKRRDWDVLRHDHKYVYGFVDPAAGGRASEAVMLIALEDTLPSGERAFVVRYVFSTARGHPLSKAHSASLQWLLFCAW